MTRERAIGMLSEKIHHASSHLGLLLPVIVFPDGMIEQVLD